MVVNALKFICGEGVIPLYYCKICGAPYLNLEEAMGCERRHSNRPTRRETMTPDDLHTLTEHRHNSCRHIPPPGKVEENPL